MTVVRSVFSRTLAALAAAAAAGLVCAAQTAPVARPPGAERPRPMTLRDLAAIPRVGDPELSPDGRTLAFIVQTADWSSRYVPHVWVQPIGGAAVQLTHGREERFPRWSPKGDTILFMAGGQLFTIAARGGEPAPLTKHGTPLVFPIASLNDQGFAWSADGRFVYFIAKDPPRPEHARSALTVFEQTDFEQQHLWKVEVSSGKEEQVTRGDWSVVSFRLARDGRHAVVLRSATPLVIDHYKSEVWILDLSTGAMRQVTSNNNYETEADLSPDGSQVYFITDANDSLDDYYGPSLFVVPATGGKPRRVSPTASYTVEMAGWGTDGTSLLALANMGLHSEIVRVDVATGATTQLTNGEHQIPTGGWNVFPTAGKMAFLYDEPTRLGDAWTLPLGGGTPTRVTGFYDSLATDFALPRQQRVTWRGADGITLEGLLYLPIDYQPGRRYPVVVQLHGGPQFSDKFGYGPGVLLNYVPVLAARGYAVFRPNYRGSAGYGPAFYRDIVGHYFNNMHLDVLAGVDQLIKDGIADPDRLALSGWSAGGTLVNKLITSTTRFKAASSGAGVANWISMMAQTDVLSRRMTWFQGTPWDRGADLMSFLNQSPIAGIGSATTPTIFFVGERDTRDPKEQSMEMYHGLQHNGVPTYLYIGDGEPHDGSAWTIRHQFEKDNRELEWFERYVMERSYTVEAPPPAVPASR
jgi:dipeptidyl aminopeptidase/acylaminoacyl peptidase